MKKYRLEIVYREDADKCEYVEESIVDEIDESVVMDDNAVRMTKKFVGIRPASYNQLITAALVSGCIVGDA